MLDKNTYDLFSGEQLKIAEKIQQRRYQLLIHSCIYYHLNSNIISDKQWDLWAKELVNLQKQYPEISKKVCLYKEFNDWDGSTGAFLPIDDDWVIQKAQSIFHIGRPKKKLVPQTIENTNVKKPTKLKRKLF